MKSDSVWALVLAGGDGIRLRELTRQIEGRPMPKQFCRILGDRSLLESTLSRTEHFASREQTMVIVSRNHLSVGVSRTVWPNQRMLELLRA